MSPDYQFVIVNYNAGSWLQRSVGSALACAGAIVHVVDNASQDGSIKALGERFAEERVSGQLRITENADNRGFAAANNQVLRELDSDFAVLMNPDCDINSATMPAIMEGFAAQPKMALASCQILNEDGSAQATSRRRFPTPASAAARMLLLDRLFPHKPEFANFDFGNQPLADDAVEYVEAISGAFMVARMSAVESVGLLDEDYFMHCEDLDWCKRFALAGWQVGFIKAGSVIHAKGVSSAGRPIRVLVTLHRGMLRFFDKFYSSETPWWLRWLVRLGVTVSLLARSALSLLKSIWTSSVKRDGRSG